MPTLLTVLILCTNANWHELERCTAPVEELRVTPDGFEGTLTSGVAFSQKPVLSDPGVQLHRFQMEEVAWYISDRGIIDAKSDLQALSIYLTNKES